ncbi:TIGR01777 family oxidoreductase [Brevibacillus choshinensis]|uniref:TIGR01777 family oxidoreductase n=1 Tax=Brevibacillus choshinensis TaxID=54911 RepID=A0ABX7FN83_BRECH|nr:TIGR01777 family oxidoreductase [Brevibacillus choshinensis]QRG66430.1 TIGR01777 family oxidoreductase [Brevibacillus choshinensis]
MSKKFVLAGGSGFLGNALADDLTERGHEVVILTRGKSRTDRSIRYVQWDGATPGDWTHEMDGCHAVVNFTGKSVNCLYTSKNKDEIIRSRLDSVRVLTDAILSCEHPPAVFVQAGSLAIFGDTEQECDENAPHGTGFSVNVCERWEEAFFARELPQTRKVLLRIGFALGKHGGALEPLAKLASLGLGGTVGSGSQYISWLHVDDLNEMFRFVIENEQVSGILNATGPNPVTNREFMKTLRNVLGKGWAPPTPAPFVMLGAYLVMRTDPSLALTGRNCVPTKLLSHGFSFGYTNLEEALRDLLVPQRVND